MAMPMTHNARIAFGDLAAVLPADGFEQYRIGRLLELRAVIDSLRAERTDRALLDARHFDRSCSRTRL